jgi:hypothetical protein
MNSETAPLPAGTGTSIHLKYGLFTGLASILIFVGLHYGGIDIVGSARNLTVLPLIFGVIMCCFAYSKAHDGYVSFGQVFSAGFKATAVAALLVILFVLLSTYIWPDMLEATLKQLQAKLDKDQRIPQKDKDLAVEWTRNNFRLISVGSTMLTFIFLGAIFSLIGAIIAKKKGSRMAGEHLDSPKNF